MEDVIRIDCFNDSLKHRVSTIYIKETCINSPDEFVSIDKGTRILITNDTWSSSLSIGSQWTIILQKPETNEWSLLLSMIIHLKAPRLLVVDLGVVLPQRFLATIVSRGLENIDTTILLYRSLASPEHPVCSHNCFLPPAADMASHGRIVSIATALWNASSGGSLPTTTEQITKVYQELGPKGMWMVLQMSSTPSLHWYQPGDQDDAEFLIRFKNLSKTLAGLFSAISR